ncbi:hypothetical protein [Nocardioides sp. AX2bis]|uniref:hypothetical protein n=1 Tax=Nocardioides sp. AX2bis TaxID=2653157 RepID=UPI0012F3D33C|nr:hypothetical protein [Nocardioides sp. AX2bis]VXC02438.1 conserved hypothetical protein [Nocardioides sp. AX2bis]
MSDHPTPDRPGPDRPAPDEAAALRARRRAAARLHHPDLGGDPDAFRRAMAAAEAPIASAPPSRGEPVVVLRRHRAISAAAVVAAGGVRLVGGLRARLPRSFPGARRYTDL